MEEEWKDIKGYEGLYQISNLGRVKSLERKANHVSGKRNVTERFIKPNTCTSYKSVCLSKKGIGKRYPIHRLVAFHFIPNPNNYPCINHKDCDKYNNKDTNLEWCDYSYNPKHAYFHNLRSSPNLNKFGKENHTSKKVVQYTINGHKIGEYGSTREAGRITGINQSCISACARGKRKTSGGYIWKYE